VSPLDTAPIEPRFLDAGEAALVVEFGRVVDPAIHDHVLALDRALAALALPGVRETVPTFRSLMIHYDPLVIERAALVERVRALETAPAPPRAAVRWTVPCCYEPPYGEDLAQIAALAGLTPERVVALHTGTELRVYMYGFVPGFCYLARLPELTISRRASVRAPHPPNTVLVADGMCVITTVAMPTGWWLIGRTPERLFAPAREPTFLVGVGDALRFASVDRASFAALEARVAAGEVVAKREQLA
jgi:inhibitor of KinA